MHSVYALTTHCMAASGAPRSASMRGSATFTTDSSTNAMVEPSTAALSTQRRRAAHSRAVGLARMAPSPPGSALGLLTVRAPGRRGRGARAPRR